MRQARRDGFTLVELLVVIGIIALLIGVLLPALNKARKSANEVACKSNLRQMGIAMFMYGSERGYFPGCESSKPKGGAVFAVWPAVLRSYMGGNMKVFACPSQDDPGLPWNIQYGPSAQNYAAGPNESGFGYKFPSPNSAIQGEYLLCSVNSTFLHNFSYGYNDWGCYQTSSPNKNYPGEGLTSGKMGLGGDIGDRPYEPNFPQANGGRVKYNHVKKPTDMIAIADRTVVPLATLNPYRFNIDPWNPQEWPSDIHRKGANVLFCDGHVDWKLQTELVQPGVEGVYPSDPDPAKRDRQVATRRLWNRDNVAN